MREGRGGEGQQRGRQSWPSSSSGFVLASDGDVFLLSLSSSQALTCFSFIFFLIGIQLLLQCSVSFHNHVNQLYVHICPFPLDPPIPPMSVITEHQAELPALYGSFALPVCYTRGR